MDEAGSNNARATLGNHRNHKPMKRGSYFAINSRKKKAARRVLKQGHFVAESSLGHLCQQKSSWCSDTRVGTPTDLLLGPCCRRLQQFRSILCHSRSTAVRAATDTISRTALCRRQKSGKIYCFSPAAGGIRTVTAPAAVNRERHGQRLADISGRSCSNRQHGPGHISGHANTHAVGTSSRNYCTQQAAVPFSRCN